jgi:hypothetical protein
MLRAALNEFLFEEGIIGMTDKILDRIAEHAVLVDLHKGNVEVNGRQLPRERSEALRTALKAVPEAFEVTYGP